MSTYTDERSGVQIACVLPVADAAGGGDVDIPDWSERLWAELRFRELVGQTSGEGFQRVVPHMKAVVGDDFMEVRPVGECGECSCDG